jgi:hypothetical protein
MFPNVSSFTFIVLSSHAFSKLLIFAALYLHLGLETSIGWYYLGSKQGIKKLARFIMICFINSSGHYENDIDNKTKTKKAIKT